MQLQLLESILSKHAASATKSPLQAAPTAADSTTPTSSSTASSAASDTGITANDFLSLLVTEMQNQDPTQQTDPMTYITQLVGVNSLEQLVQINQDLTPSTTSTTGDAASTAMTPTAAAAQTSTSTNPLAAAAQNAATLALPAGSHLQMLNNSPLAVSQAFVNSAPKASQAAPAQLAPVSPEAMRAIQMSIPGATITGISTPAASTGVAGGQIP